MRFGRRLVPAAIRRRYTVKFAIVLLILAISVGAIGLVGTAAITDETEEIVQNEHAALAEQEAQNLQTWTKEKEEAGSAIARSDVIDEGEPDEVADYLQDWGRSQSYDDRVFYVDTDSDEILASSREWYVGDSMSEYSTISDDAYENGSVFSPSLIGPHLFGAEDNQFSAVTYVYPTDDDRAIVYTADLDGYESASLGEGDVTRLILDDQDGVMYDESRFTYGEDFETFGAEYDDAEMLAETRQFGVQQERVESQPSGALGHDVYGFDSDDYIVSTAPVWETGWVVAIHEPTDEAYGFVNALDQYGTVATLLGVLMIGLVGAVLGRSTAVSIDRLTDKAQQMEDGDLDVDLETTRIDNIGRLYDGFDSMRNALREQIEEVEKERERIETINANLEMKADEYSDVMEAAADGDMTARMDPDSENEAMEEIAMEFNTMLEEIEQTVAELNRFATDVATASEQVTASSEEVRSASQQVTESVQEISDGAQRQNQSLQSVNQEMSGLSTTTEEIAASSNEVADIAKRTVDTGQEGQVAAQDAIGAMNEIEGEAESAVDEIRRLEEEVQQIDELIATISEIARQTNMLALNANIEASRSASGDSDEGFSVVAKEVKALSEDVAQAADEAEDRLKAIRERTEQSAAEVEGTSDDIETAGEKVQEAVDALAEIADLAQETNIGVQEISAATEEQAASTQEVVAMVDDASTISEETTTEAENVAAAAEEQTTALTEVTRSASNLSEQAAHLSQGLDRFDTDVDHAEMELLSASDFEAQSDDEPALDLGGDGEDDGDDGRGITIADDESDGDTEGTTSAEATTNESITDSQASEDGDASADEADLETAGIEFVEDDVADSAVDETPATETADPLADETSEQPDETTERVDDGSSNDVPDETDADLAPTDDASPNDAPAETADPLAEGVVGGGSAEADVNDTWQTADETETTDSSVADDGDNGDNGDGDDEADAEPTDTDDVFTFGDESDE
ncbi:methyl-accepting chemotaxis protein [Natrialbaceae archaeon A-arb3/5]